jgi:hypothetical protein
MIMHPIPECAMSERKLSIRLNPADNIVVARPISCPGRRFPGKMWR